MLTSILSLIAGAATIVGGILAYKNSANRQRRNAERDVAKKEAALQAKKDEIRSAVYSNDESAINALAARLLAPSACFAACCALLLNAARLLATPACGAACCSVLLHAARLLAPPACGAACCAVLLLGCSTRPPAVCYVPTDRRIEPCTNSIGIACQAVPNAVFCELLEKAQELKDLKSELSVDKRLSK